MRNPNVAYHLTIVHPFKQYTKGQRITDADEVALILASPQHTHVVKTTEPDDPAPAAPPSFGEHD